MQSVTNPVSVLIITAQLQVISEHPVRRVTQSGNQYTFDTLDYKTSTLSSTLKPSCKIPESPSLFENCGIKIESDLHEIFT